MRAERGGYLQAACCMDGAALMRRTAGPTSVFLQVECCLEGPLLLRGVLLQAPTPRPSNAMVLCAAMDGCIWGTIRSAG